MTCPHDITEREVAAHDGYCPLCLRAENERLREALQAIDEANFDGDDVAIQNIARAALKPKE
jgi:hypothetical protein